MLGKMSKVPAAYMRFVRVISFLFLISTALAQNGPTIPVKCDKGQSLNSTLSRLNRKMPTTILVQGTCTEYVLIDGFDGLTVNGLPGATLQQPNTNPQNSRHVLWIRASRGVTVSGLAVRSLPSGFFPVIGISGGSNKVLLQNVSADGSWGVFVYEASQVWVVNAAVNITSGFAGISAVDKSDVHIVDGLIQRPANSNFNAGLFVASGHVTMQGMTIRDMQQSIIVATSGSVDLVNFDSAAAGVDVTIDNPSGTNLDGAIVNDGSSLNLSSARLLINHAGQPWGNNTGGVFVTNGSTLDAGPNLIVSNSQGEGVIVTNNSHATLAGSSITGSLHGGLVVANLSTIDVQSSNSLTPVGGNAPDLFCDSNSFITGTVNLAGVPTVSCSNLLSGNTVPLP